jgi:hypothetical protein
MNADEKCKGGEIKKIKLGEGEEEGISIFFKTFCKGFHLLHSI